MIIQGEPETEILKFIYSCI